MRTSWRAGRLAGIDFEIHFTFPLILGLGALQWGAPHGATGAAFGILLTLALFACVALHELGHSLMARAFGVGTRRILLLPIGGVAELTQPLRRPREELLVALAGPAVNVVIAGGLSALLGLKSAFGLLDPRGVLEAMEGPSVTTFLGWLLGANVTLVLFNLIPAFPMDGGRVLRAILSWRLGHARATGIAARVGQGFAVLFAITAVVTGELMLGVLAVFLYFAAGQERAMEDARNVLGRVTAGAAARTGLLPLAPGDRLGAALQRFLTSPDDALPVVHGNTVVGVLTRDRLVHALATGASEDDFVAGVTIREVPHLAADQTLEEVLDQLVARNATVGAVVANGKFVGLVSQGGLREAIRLATALRWAEMRRGQRDAA
jgi:Zn-dependent protease/CBS domain-containing protein